MTAIRMNQAKHSSASSAARTQENRRHRQWTWFTLSSAFFIPFFMLLALCILKGITPFGDKTFLYEDMKRQYVDFYAYYRSLTGSPSIAYSFETSLGEPMTGFFAYYLTSPLLVPFLFLPFTAYPTAITFLILTKCGLCGLTAAIYLSRHNAPHSSHPLATLFCSTSYALSAYMMANMANTMWIDAILMMPLVLLGIDRILQKKRSTLYLFSLAAMLYFNYYIAYMVILFSILYFLLYYISAQIIAWRSEYAHGGKKPFHSFLFQTILLKYIGASFLGASLPAFLLVPTFLELSGSTKDSLHKGLTVTFSNLSPDQIISKMFSLAFNSDQIMFGQPHLYCGILLLFPFFLYFGSRQVARREKWIRFLLLLILFLSFSLAPVDILWHAGTEPLGYLYRYAFLFVFLMVCCAHSFLCAFAEHALPDLLPEKTPIQNTGRSALSAKPLPKWLSFFLPVLLLLLLFGCLLFFPKDYLGGKKTLLNLALLLFSTGCILLLHILTMKRTPEDPADKISAVKKLPAQRLCAILLFGLMFLQAADLEMNAVYIYQTNAQQMTPVSSFVQDAHLTGQEVQSVKEKDNGFYRMEHENERTENESMAFGYNGLTHYDSSSSTSVRNFLSALGYQYNGLFVEHGNDNTTSADALLGIRYTIAENGGVKDTSQALPVIFGTKSGISAGACSTGSAFPDPFTLQEEICSGLTGNTADPVFCPAQLTPTTAAQDKSYVEYTVTTEADGELYFYLTTPTEEAENLELFYNGESLGGFANAGTRRVLDFGYHQKGDCFLFRVVMHGASDRISALYFMTEDTASLQHVKDTLSDGFGTITEISSSNLRIELPKGQKSIFTSIPYSPNWHAAINGQTVQTTQIYNALLSIRVPDEMNEEPLTIEMEYIPAGRSAGIRISLTGLCILLVSLCISIRKKTCK